MRDIRLHDLKILKRDLTEFFYHEGEYLNTVIGNIDIEILYAHRTPREYSMYITDRRLPELTNAYHFDQTEDIQIESFGSLSDVIGNTHRLTIDLLIRVHDSPYLRYTSIGTVKIQGSGLDLTEYNMVDGYEKPNIT